MTDQELLDHSIQLYKKTIWAKGEVISYMAVDTDTNKVVLDYSEGAGCHAKLQLDYNSKNYHPDYILNAVTTTRYPEKLSKSETEAYYDYLFNRSPFRESYLTKDPATVWSSGVAVTCHGLPNPVSAMGFKAIRHAWEKPWLYRTMRELVDNGRFTEHEGFFLSFLFDADLKQTLTTGHVVIYPTYLDTCALYNFVNERHPVLTTRSKSYHCMKEVGGFQGVPEYWNRTPITDKLIGFMQRHKTFKYFVEKTASEEHVNPFGLLPLLFRAEKAVDKFGPLRTLVADLYTLAEREQGLWRKVG